VLGRSNHPVDERHQAGQQGDCAKQIQSHRRRRQRVTSGDEPYRTGRDGKPDGDVDEEDPLPTKRRRNDAAKEHADGYASAADRPPDGQRVGSLRTGVCRCDDGQGGRQQKRRTEALRRARDNQRVR
jgi:hypothetical protein